FQAEDGIRDYKVTGVQTCALPIYLDAGYVIAGSPQTVRQQLTECIKSLRVGHLMVLLQIGSMPKDLTLHNTELFAREVMPHVRRSEERRVGRECRAAWLPDPQIEQ